MTIQSHFEFLSVADSHTGNVRQLNEDSYIEMTNQQLWAVADGMGGHDAGDVASQLIIQNLNEFKASRHLGNNIRTLNRSIHCVNDELLNLAKLRNSELIGSTLVIFHAIGHYGICAWVGDSRLYLLRNHRLKQISRDHILANEYAEFEAFYDDLEITQTNDNAITRAVGGHPDLKIDYLMMEIMQNDIFLLCTDGLTGEISDIELEKILTKNSIQKSVKTLMKTTLQRDARDNITLVVIQIL